MSERSADGTPDLARRLAGEAVGTAFLLATVVGSGIMGDRLSGGNVAVALLANSIATGAVLFVLIACLGPVSGAHFNPAVTVGFAMRGRIAWRDAGMYILVQVLAGIAGVVVAHGMFIEPAFAASATTRSGVSQLLSEFVATFGLVGFIWAAVLKAPRTVAAVVGCYIASAYWFTSSTSFANPAVTVARSITDTFAGIRPTDVPGFVLAQLAGAVAATTVFCWLSGREEEAMEERESGQIAKVIFACVHNAGRSQMAAAFFNELADPTRAQAISAGTAPADAVHPEVLVTMREAGIDLSGAQPQRLTTEVATDAALLVTMGCGEQCPNVPGLERQDWPLPDPKGQAQDAVVKIRDDIRERVTKLLRARAWAQA